MSQMTDLHTAPVYDEPSPRLLHTLFFMEQVCLGLTVQIAAIVLIAWLVPGTESLFPAALLHIGPEEALSALFCSISFFLSEPNRSTPLRIIGWLCAGFTLFLSSACVLHGDCVLPPGIAHLFPALASSDRLLAVQTGASVRSAIIFGLLAIISILVRSGATWANRIADFLKIAALLIFIHIFWEFLLSVTGILPVDGRKIVSPELLSCLALLVGVSVLRESALPLFRVYIGSSMGSRIARWLLPVLFTLQILREIIRGHFTHIPSVSVFYSLPILTTIASLTIFVLVLFIALRINRLERTIRDLTLRDGLTGLYNVKGFHLLAESALLTSRRAGLPFAVLFIDLDRLKQINDTHGHHIGSAALTETAKLLANTFRENDVVGRIGGDEFAVAGQFDELTLDSAINRLRAGTASRSPELQRRFPLSFSIGYAVAEQDSAESLRELIARADSAMYHDKSSSREMHLPA